jgi:hypothetical protein
MAKAPYEVAGEMVTAWVSVVGSSAKEQLSKSDPKTIGEFIGKVFAEVHSAVRAAAKQEGEDCKDR